MSGLGPLQLVLVIISVALVITALLLFAYWIFWWKKDD